MDFATRLDNLMTAKGVTKFRVSTDLGVSSGLLSAWGKGTKKPSYDNIIALADYFGVSIDYLMGRSNERPAPAKVLSKREERLLAAFVDLEPEDQLIELGRIEAMADAARKKHQRPGAVG